MNAPLARTRHVSWAAALAAAALLVSSLAACSSDDSSTGVTETSTAEATEAEATETETDSETEEVEVAEVDPEETESVSPEAVAAVVDAANAFLATLDESQAAEVVVDMTNESAAAWSNLPCGSSCRNGIQFSTLSEDQLTAANAVLKAALNTSVGVGYDQAMQILLADDVLGAEDSGGGGGGGRGGGGGGGGGYSSGTYFMAFLGTPSMEDTWMLQFGGHHLAVNITYSDGTVTGGSPFFIGVEPTTWTAEDGTTYAPLDIMHDGMVAMLASLTTEELAAAKLSESFSDVLLGPDADGGFPETASGIPVADLTDEQKLLVLEAMNPWVSVMSDQAAEDLLAIYADELDETYISYSGSPDLLSHADYVRIDGPSVWIEFVCQDGVVYRDVIHYHTVYRDQLRDYGGELTF